MRSTIIESLKTEDLRRVREKGVDAVIAPAPADFIEFTARLSALSRQQIRIFVSQVRSNASNLDKLEIQDDPTITDLINQADKLAQRFKSIFQMAVSPQKPFEVKATLGRVGFLEEENKRTQPWHVDFRQSYVMTWALAANGTSYITNDMPVEDRIALIQERKLPDYPLEVSTLDSSMFLISKQKIHPEFDMATGLIHRAENLGLNRVTNTVGTMDKIL